MFKFLLLLTLIVLCGSLGLVKSYSYKSRVRELNHIRNAFRVIRAEVCYKKETLPVLFKKIKLPDNTLISTVVNTCNNEMSNFSNFDICWNISLNKVCTNSCLKKDDINILHDLVGQLGRSNATGQSNTFDLLDENLKRQIEDAERESFSKGKMYSGLGFTMGIVISVLLI